ncbi:MAG: 3'-5' exonuclease [Alloprevotella sp.]|nr:3'-5' exonuclease [Alloprevotella sp.]
MMEQPHSSAPISLADELNESQLEAVTYCDGPALVIAGAGSGKTRVLTFKIAYLLQLGYQPWSILSLTFTNKAAREMNERIAQIVGEGFTHQIWSGTFHSIFGRILRREAEYIGFTSQFTIYDTTDSRSLIKTIIKEMGLTEKAYKPNHIHSIISDAKNRLMLPEAYAMDYEAQRLNAINGIRKVADIYKEYFARCKRANAMDFDDLLLYTFLLFRDNPEVLERYKERFQYILVDEYQDTNYAQHKIITQIAPPTARVFVVGDDAQSIYSFRGANIDNILRFNEQYPTARLIKLERNYRSTQNIVEAANSIIRHNANQIPKTVYSNNEVGELVTVLSAHSDREESMKIAGEIKRLCQKENLAFSDFAVLYRTNAQSRSLEETFRGNGIPCRVYGGLSFYQRKEIKDVLAYLRAIVNTHDDEAIKRIINYPSRGIGDTTINKLQMAVREHAVPLWEVLGNPSLYGVVINRGTESKLSAFRNLLSGFIEQAKVDTAYKIAYKVVFDTGIFAELNAERTIENISKKENIDELLNSIQSYQDEQLEETGSRDVSLANYLSQVSLLTDSDEKDPNEPFVTLMTVHAAKGLEFETVFVTGMEEELFPSSSAKFYRQEMEEERRLFYVAVTRAKRYCYLTYATSRYKFGKMEFSVPSSFIKEIQPQYLRYEDKAFLKNSQERMSESSQRPVFFKSIEKPADNPSLSTAHLTRIATTPKTTSNVVEHLHCNQGELRKGARIEHERFGIGTVTHLESAGDSSKITVTFDTGETKNLLLKFAKFQIIG